MLIDVPQYVFALWQQLVMSRQKENINATYVGWLIAKNIILQLSTTNMPVQLSWPEHLTLNQGVEGSNPPTGTIKTSCDEPF